MEKGFDFHTIVNSKKAISESVPPAHGVYFFRSGGTIVYIGKSINLKARLLSHLENARIDAKEAAIIDASDSIDYILTDSEFKALLLESELIKKHKPKYNARWRDDKSYLYIKITLKDDFPKVLPVRRERDGKSRYFGPFPSMDSIEEIIKSIRYIFPFCTQARISKHSCFYSKIKMCRPCPNAVNALPEGDEKNRLKREYRANIRQVIKILEGKTDAVLKDLYKRLKILTKQERYEEALQLRDKIYRIEHLIHDRIFAKDIIQDYNQSQERIESLRSLLQKFFPDVPELTRVECYDISNLSQREATASMVVFTGGMPDKSQYRRFRIKNPELQSDFDMFEEVLVRRFKQDWPLPDLIVIDGGRPQIRRVLQVFGKNEVQKHFIGIAKHPDRLVMGLPEMPIVRPPVHHPGFSMIRAIRDESHRFAKKYHLLLRNKKLGI